MFASVTDDCPRLPKARARPLGRASSGRRAIPTRRQRDFEATRAFKGPASLGLGSLGPQIAEGRATGTGRSETRANGRLPETYDFVQMGPQRPERMSVRDGGCTLFRTRLHAYAAIDDKFEHSHLISAREDLVRSGRRRAATSGSKRSIQQSRRRARERTAHPPGMASVQVGPERVRTFTWRVIRSIRERSLGADYFGNSDAQCNRLWSIRGSHDGCTNLENRALACNRLGKLTGAIRGP